MNVVWTLNRRLVLTGRDFVNETPVDDFVIIDLLSSNRSINRKCMKRDSSAICFYVNQYLKNCFREKRIDIESDGVLLNNTLQNLNEENHHFVVLDGSTDLLGRFSAITNKELYLGSPFFFGFVKVIKHKKWDPNKRFSSHNLKLSCLLYTSPSPRDQRGSRMPSSA